jgi:hypothetical protein
MVKGFMHNVLAASLCAARKLVGARFVPAASNQYYSWTQILVIMGKGCRSLSVRARFEVRNLQRIFGGAYGFRKLQIWETAVEVRDRTKAKEKFTQGLCGLTSPRRWSSS